MSQQWLVSPYLRVLTGSLADGRVAAVVNHPHDEKQAARFCMSSMQSKHVSEQTHQEVAGLVAQHPGPVVGEDPAELVGEELQQAGRRAAGSQYVSRCWCSYVPT